MINPLWRTQFNLFSHYGYDKDTQCLYIVFPNAVFEYRGVPASFFKAFHRSQNQTAFFNQHIQLKRGQDPAFAYRRLGESEIILLFGENPIRQRRNA